MYICRTTPHKPHDTASHTHSTHRTPIQKTAMPRQTTEEYTKDFMEAMRKMTGQPAQPAQPAGVVNSSVNLATSTVRSVLPITAGHPHEDIPAIDVSNAVVLCNPTEEEALRAEENIITAAHPSHDNEEEEEQEESNEKKKKKKKEKSDLFPKCMKPPTKF